MSLELSRLDLTSLGSPVNTLLSAVFTDSAGTSSSLGTVPVSGGTATVNLTVPATAAAGGGTLVLTAAESGTVVRAAVTVSRAEPQDVRERPAATGRM
jgi:5'-nucleotidase